ncbi:hypothetical protein CAter10_4542 [Collimonas arenae]|nr:hypothetical protein CAter10_4542 [Collimonas arenae]
MAQALNQLKGLPVKISKVKPESRSDAEKDDKDDKTPLDDDKAGGGAIIKKEQKK